MTSSAHGVVVDEGATADRAIVLTDFQVLTGVTGQDPAPITVSGTYTPTLTNTANVSASSASVCQWQRNGNVMTVSGSLTVDPTTTSTLTQLDISLPAAATNNFTGVNQLGGVGASVAVATEAYAIQALVGATKARMTWLAGNVTNLTVAFSFQFLIV